jgi:penicillin-binding protein 1C
MVAGILLAAAVIGLGVAIAWLVPLPDRLSYPGSVSVRESGGETLHVFLAPDGRWRIPVEVSDVDSDYIDALLRFEDKRFAEHFGVDLFAILRAARLNLSQGQVVSGASTITMQLVRLVESRPRTLRSKIVEVFRAMQFEARMSKPEILRAYLRFASFGRNIEGVEAGALSCFGHRADHLSKAEIATLLAIPQNPQPRYPRERNRARLKRARDRIAGQLFSEEGAAEVAREAVPIALRPMPRRAPHFGYWARSRAPAGNTVIESTLRGGIQRQTEERMRAAEPLLAQQGIRHGTAVVIDHRTMELVAVVGNLSWDRDIPGRQIPAFDVRRSPGSTLKPFIYAQAIDEGRALPGFLVPDIPVAYGDYSPRNYDGSFNGLVRLDDALSRSLNVPFVQLLGALKTDRFLARLRRMGVTGLASDPEFYGLSVAVGGIELTPLEVATLYATLARGGVYEPLQIGLDSQAQRAEVGDSKESEAATGRGDPVFSSGASYLTRNTLGRRGRPGFGQRKAVAALSEQIHWKTGTSSGRRDAWAVGSGSQYTVAVWLGNLDNKSSAYLVGADAAGPLFFDLIEAVHRGEPLAPQTQPPELTEVAVCAYSGHLPGPACSERDLVLARETGVPTSVCPYHRSFEVDVESGLAVSPGCRSGRATDRRSHLVWPASIRRWLEHRAGGLPEPPRWAEGCSRPGGEAGPQIVHPPAGHVALLMPGMEPSRQQLPLVAEAGGGEALDWFVDGQFVGHAPAAQRLWWIPSPGQHLIVASDENGRLARRSIEVRLRR